MAATASDMKKMIDMMTEQRQEQAELKTFLASMNKTLDDRFSKMEANNEKMEKEMKDMIARMDLMEVKTNSLSSGDPWHRASIASGGSTKPQGYVQSKEGQGRRAVSVEPQRSTPLHGNNDLGMANVARIKRFPSSMIKGDLIKATTDAITVAKISIPESAKVEAKGVDKMASVVFDTASECTSFVQASHATPLIFMDDDNQPHQLVAAHDRPAHLRKRGWILSMLYGRVKALPKPPDWMGTDLGRGHLRIKHGRKIIPLFKVGEEDVTGAYTISIVETVDAMDLNEACLKQIKDAVLAILAE